MAQLWSNILFCRSNTEYGHNIIRCHRTAVWYSKIYMYSYIYIYLVFTGEQQCGHTQFLFIHRHKDAFTPMFLLHDLFTEPHALDIFLSTQITSHIEVKYWRSWMLFPFFLQCVDADVWNVVEMVATLCFRHVSLYLVYCNAIQKKSIIDEALGFPNIKQ